MAIVRTFTYNILNLAYVREMEEYVELTLRDRRMSGVLFRGTDYATAVRQHASPHAVCAISAEDVIPVIRERIVRFHYDDIFLHTGDAEDLRAIREVFPQQSDYGRAEAVQDRRFRVGPNDQ